MDDEARALYALVRVVKIDGKHYKAVPETYHCGGCVAEEEAIGANGICKKITSTVRELTGRNAACIRSIWKEVDGDGS